VQTFPAEESGDRYRRGTGMNNSSNTEILLKFFYDGYSGGYIIYGESAIFFHGEMRGYYIKAEDDVWNSTEPPIDNQKLLDLIKDNIDITNYTDAEIAGFGFEPVLTSREPEGTEKIYKPVTTS
jgi:hypothetical protein